MHLCTRRTSRERAEKGSEKKLCTPNAHTLAPSHSQRGQQGWQQQQRTRQGQGDMQSAPRGASAHTSPQRKNEQRVTNPARGKTNRTDADGEDEKENVMN
ncbi:hypothetical protein N7536_010775 [Penicillium majusculum]|nr:hypothetical protein N7536_010775 [Penicillium majusculum]